MNNPHCSSSLAAVLPTPQHSRFPAGSSGQCDCSVLGQCDCSVLGQCDCSRVPAETALLTAWLHITDRCNLRCSYCYLPHEPADMPPETARAVVDAVCRSALAHGYQQMRFKYAGGEPLLRFAQVAETHRYAQMTAAEHGLLVDGVVLSNGTLLNQEMIASLQALRLGLVISLDGLGAAHNSQRPYASGRGSAQDVTRAIELALAHGLVPGISITVSGRSADDLPAVVAWVLERDLPFRINFYRENDRSAVHHDLSLETEQIVSGMLAAYRVIEARMPRRSLLAALLDHGNLSVEHQHPCNLGQSYLVFDPWGRVTGCQMQMGQPVTDLHAADPLAVIRASMQTHNPPVDEKAGCRSCEWKYWCAGGCPLAAHRAAGSSAMPSPNCAIYRALYPEVLRLERLRVVQYGEFDTREESELCRASEI